MVDRGRFERVDVWCSSGDEIVGDGACNPGESARERKRAQESAFDMKMRNGIVKKDAEWNRETRECKNKAKRFL